jgi:hypothetical protein
MDDVRGLNHNLGGRDIDFMDNYDFDEDSTLTISTRPYFSENWQDKKVEAFDLYSEDGEFGYAIKVDGKVEHLIGIYEPHGCELNSKRGLITAFGHEEIIQLWLEDGEFDEIATR